MTQDTFVTVAPEELPSPPRTAPNLPGRVLHWWRRRTALRRLSRRPHPPPLLFLCHGNLCRSPFAAGVARQLLPSWVDVASAGFLAPGRRSPPEALAAAGEFGVDLSAHRSEILTVDHLRNTDLVVVMDRDQRRRLVTMQPALASRVVLLGDLDPVPTAERDVPDPVNQPLDAFRSAYGRIHRCVRALAGAWSQQAGTQPRG